MAQTVKQTLYLEDKMSGTLSKVQQNAIRNIQTFNKMSNEVDQLKRSLEEAEKINPEIVKSDMYYQAVVGLEEMEAKLYDASKGQVELKQTTDVTQKSLSAFDIVAANLVTKGLSKLANGAKQLVSLSDQYKSTTARLNNLTESEEQTLALQDKIYAAANRSRGSYQALSETVAKLGMQTEGVFGNTDEIVAFSELLNKTFTVSGIDSNSINSIMYNLTQSLSNGALLGPDYKILKQNAPQMIKYLQEYFKTNAAGLDEMVSKGQVTAEAVKAAMFNATDDINKKFESMPVTFDQLWTKITNDTQRVMRPLLDLISNAITFIYNNWSTIAPIMIEAATAVGIFSTAWATLTAIEWLSVPAHWAVITPMLILVGLIAGFIVILNLAAQKLSEWSGTSVSAIGMVMGAFNVLKQLVINVAVTMLNVFVENFSGIISMWISLEQVILSGIYKIAQAMDAVFGSNLSSIVGGFLEGLENIKTSIENYKAKDVDWDLSKAYQQGYDFGADLQSNFENIENPLDKLNTTMSSVIAPAGGGGGGGGKAIKTTSDDNLLTDEDIQLLLDVATRDYQLNYQQMTPNITLGDMYVRETADVDAVMDRLGERIDEFINGDAEVKNYG